MTRLTIRGSLIVYNRSRETEAGGTGARPKTPARPSFGGTLDDTNITDVLTYARNRRGNAAPAVTPGEIASPRVSMKP
jgi:hypothetical protein